MAATTDASLTRQDLFEVVESYVGFTQFEFIAHVRGTMSILTARAVATSKTTWDIRHITTQD